MNRILFLAFAIFLISFSARADWGKTGHRVVGEIAENYLTQKSKRAIAELLDGHSLAFVSNYGDDIKSDPLMDKYKPWHYVNFPFGRKYESYPKNPEGDIIQGIETCVKVLKNPSASKMEKAFHLKLLVHFIGDLHQPLHIGIAEDRGGNRFQVQWFGSGTNLHTVWDSKMLDSYGMSYTEVAANEDKLGPKQIKEIQKGTVLDWVYDSRKLTEYIYDCTSVGDKLGYEYMYEFTDPMRKQLQKGGIRLAKMLNDIFG